MAALDCGDLETAKVGETILLAVLYYIRAVVPDEAS